MFRQEAYTIDQINFDEITIEKDQKRFPENLSGLLFPAVDARQYLILQNLCHTIQNAHLAHISYERIVGQICYAAFAAGYTESEFGTLLDTLNIDANHSANYAEYSGQTKQTSLATAPLTHLAIHFASKAIFSALINRGAEPENKDDKNRTADEYLNECITSHNQWLKLDSANNILQSKIAALQTMQQTLANNTKQGHSPRL